MDNYISITVTDEEKNKYISALTPELMVLRSRAGISQEDLAALIGVSRQTYGSIERRVRRMSWNTYLSLILLYDYNSKTHDMLRATDAFPYELIKRFNGETEKTADGIDKLLSIDMKGIFEKLDEQAFRSIKTLVMLEYARCTNTPGDVVVKSFDGIKFAAPSSDQDDKQASRALRSIKRKRKNV